MIKQVEIGALHFEDYKELLVAIRAAYQGWQGGYWSADAIQSLISKFPEGQIVIKSGGVVIGCALSLIVDYKKFGDVHTYKENYRQLGKQEKIKT